MGNWNMRAVGATAVATLAAATMVGVPVSASAAVDPASKLIINEVYGGGGNSGATLTNDFVELYNTGDAPVDLSAYSVQYASATGTSYQLTPLTGSIAPQGYYLVQEAQGAGGADALPTPDAVGTIPMSGSNGKVALVNSATALAGSIDPATDETVVDYVGYGSADVSAGSGPAPALSNTTSANRTDFANTADNAADFTTAAPSPTAGDTAPPPPPVDAGELAIAEIQGEGDVSPSAGQIVTTTGVVTAAYPTGGISGFDIQTGGTGGPRDGATASDGLFVYVPDGGFDAAIGDSVSVTGEVSEFNGLTELTATAITPIDALEPVTPATTPSWPADAAGREPLESMLYAPGAFTVTDVFRTNQYGEVGLAAGDSPLVQPTDAADAGSPEAAAIAADNAARGVILDDGSTVNYLSGDDRDSVPPYVSATEPVRVGAAVTFAEPVIVSYGFDSFRFQPTTQVTGETPATERPTFADTRTDAPAPVGGDLSVASFNVLNYFTTLGRDVEGCTSFDDRTGDPITVNRCPGEGPRGAFDPEDLQRQQDKIVAAINTNDAAVTGLMEIENSVVLGDPVDEAVGTLVGALNAAAGSEKWAIVASSSELPPAAEMDVISNAIIYQPALVERVGESRALGTESAEGQAFANAREPLGQAFTPVAGGEPFFVSVNHFKSKGSGVDDGTGQGLANPDRVAQATALAAWVPTVLPEGVSDAFVLGDFNAYTQEDPLQVLYQAGYANLGAPDDYSYSFAGLSGSLDHVLANAPAQARVTGADVWNINAEESPALEYSRFNVTAGDFYAPGPFRSSDHDPVLVGFSAAGDAPTGGGGGGDGTVDLNLVDINDFHGRIDSNTVAFAGTVEQLREAAGEDNTLFVSAGDNIGASLYASSAQQDQPTIDVLNAMDLDVSALGNHEFDRGRADVDGRVTDAADWEYLGANIYEKGTQTPAYPEYALVDKGGLTIGVIGAVTQETPSLVTPAGIDTLDFGDPTDAINRVAAQLSDGDDANGEADVIVAALHEGASEGTPEGATIESEIAEGGAFAKIATQTAPEVDAIFTGHTHKEYVFDAPVGDTGRTRPIIQTGAYGANIGQAILTVDAATGDPVSYVAQNVERTETPAEELVAQYPRVAEVQQITDDALAAAAVTGGVPVGEIGADITRAFGNGAYVDGTYQVPDGEAVAEDRSEESSVGHLVANAVRDAEYPSGETPDVGVTNPGGLRADLLYAGSTGPDADTNGDGVVTVAEAVAVQPFANSVFLATLTGAQMKTLLEQQDQPEGASRPYLALGLSDNVSYTYDRTRAVGDRITSITVNGETVTADATFRVATNSFLASGGDNFTVLAEAADPTDTGLIDLDIFTDAIAAGSPVEPNFAKSGVSVQGLDPAVDAGSTVEFQVADLGLTSLGAPEVTEVTASIGDAELGTFPVTPSEDTPGAGNDQTGTATVSVTVPDGLTGPQTLTLTAAGGTTVSIPLTVTQAAPVEADLGIAISGATGLGDGRATVTVTVTNAGPGTAAPASASLDVYGTVRVVDGGEGTVAGGRVTFATPELAAGASATFPVTVAKRGFLGFGLLVGQLSGATDDPNGSNDRAVRFALIF